ncbi:MAG: HAMP domain-containing histidine kinase [Acidobacteria bacterium]|nr:HAMP domain-containing histidine kinase [Acidobacteriota bacterium]
MTTKSNRITRIALVILIALTPVLTGISWSRQRQLDRQRLDESSRLLLENPAWCADLISGSLEQQTPWATWTLFEGLSGSFISQTTTRDLNRTYSGIPIDYVRLIDEPYEDMDQTDLQMLLSGYGLTRSTYLYFMQRLSAHLTLAIPFRQMFQLEPPANQDALVRVDRGNQTLWFQLTPEQVAVIQERLTSIAPGLRVASEPIWSSYDQVTTNLAFQSDPSALRHDSFWNTFNHTLISIAVLSSLIMLWLALSAHAKALRLQKELVAATSHELRTPITAIRQHSELLLDQLPVEAPESSYARHIERESRRLQHMVENLLQTARFEQGLPPLNLQPARLEGFLHDICTPWQRSFPECALKLDAKRVTVVWDKHLITQAVINLLDNARIHGAPPILIKADLTGDLVQLTIRDHGQGLKTDSSPELSSHGLGLGLAICREIIERHGGDMHFGHADPGLMVKIKLPQTVHQT